MPAIQARTIRTKPAVELHVRTRALVAHHISEWGTRFASKAERGFIIPAPAETPAVAAEISLSKNPAAASEHK